MNDTIRLTHAVECTRHKGVILRRIAEHHQLGSTHAHIAARQFGCLSNYGAHHLHSVHVDAAFGGTDVHRRTHHVRLCQCAGNAFNQADIAR